MKLNTIFIIGLLILTCQWISAQEKKSSFNGILQWGKNKADKISMGKFDTNYVTTPTNRWMIFTNISGSNNRFSFDMPVPNMNVDEYSKAYPDFKQLSTYKFRMHQGTQGISLGLGYGSIRGKYSISFGNRNEKQFGLECLGSRLGGFVDYRHSKHMKGTGFDAFEALWNRIMDPYPNPQHTTQELREMYTKEIESDRNDYTTLHIQGHYVFNARHFSYSAARTATRIQKRSAGSAIALVDFYQSKAKFHSSLLLGDDENYKTWKGSMGGGYAYNYTPNQGKLLFHASVIPSVTIVSKSSYNTHFQTLEEYIRWSYEIDHNTPFPCPDIETYKAQYPDDFSNYNTAYGKAETEFRKSYREIEDLVGSRAKITLNCTARLSATWNINEHYVVGAYGSYQYSNFANKERYHVKENNFNGYVFLGYRF